MVRSTLLRQLAFEELFLPRFAPAGAKLRGAQVLYSQHPSSAQLLETRGARLRTLDVLRRYPHPLFVRGQPHESSRMSSATGNPTIPPSCLGHLG